MKIEVIKFGGTSVADANKIKNVAKIINQKTKNKISVIVVVSAMGKSTNNLIDLAKEMSNEPNHREMDVFTHI